MVYAPPCARVTAVSDNDEIDSAALEKIFRAPVKFVLSVAALDQLPPITLPEIAFIGRSNVGKSSLLNALLGQKYLARASNTPGRTQQLNFFDLNNQCYLVDMPGYGYAQAPKDIVAEWQGLVKDYLRGRTSLRRVYALIDSRHGIKKNDHDMLSMLDETAVPYQVVLTKLDKISGPALVACVAEATQQLIKHPAAWPAVIATSSQKAVGIDELRASIASAFA